MRISDVIERVLKDALRANDGQVTFSRNRLADQLDCVPSQVSYVISTRFTTSRGYYVESRRGGGGSISIQHMYTSSEPSKFIMHLMTSLSEALSQHDVEVLLTNCLDFGAITPAEERLFRSALSDQALAEVPASKRDRVRRQIFQNMLLQLALNLEVQDASRAPGDAETPQEHKKDGDHR